MAVARETKAERAVAITAMTFEERRALSRSLTFAERAAVDVQCDCPADAKRGWRCTKDAMRCNGRYLAWLNACDMKRLAARKGASK